MLELSIVALTAGILLGYLIGHHSAYRDWIDVADRRKIAVGDRMYSVTDEGPISDE